MRVVIYVPSVRGVVRTGRAVAREVQARGHEVTGITDSPALAHAAYESGEVDRIAGRQRHLLDLANAYTFTRTPWALAVDRPTRGPARAGAWLLPLPGLVEWMRHQQRWVAAAAAVVAGVAGTALLLPHPPKVRPDAAPSAAPSRASLAPSPPPPRPAVPASPPPAVPAPRPPVMPYRSPQSPPRSSSPPELAGEGGGGPSPSPSITPSSPPSPSVSPVCVLQLHVPRVVDVRACQHRP